MSGAYEAADSEAALLMEEFIKIIHRHETTPDVVFMACVGILARLLTIDAITFENVESELKAMHLNMKNEALS